MNIMDKVQMLKQILIVILKIAEIIAKAIDTITEAVQEGVK